KLPTIGFLGVSTSLAFGQWVAAFVQRLRELGWIEGRTVAIEYRWAEGHSERFPEIAAELVVLPKFHPPWDSHRLFDDVQLCPKPVRRAAGLARIHRTAIMPVTSAVTKTKTSIRPLASDTRAGPGQYPASPQPTPKITAPEIRDASMAVEVG